jgi:hypothetical protein
MAGFLVLAELIAAWQQGFWASQVSRYLSKRMNNNDFNRNMI